MLYGEPAISIVITSYAMERFKDVCDLLDSVRCQTLLAHAQDRQGIQGSRAVKPEPEAVALESNKSIGMGSGGDGGGQSIEVIFVADSSRELYLKAKEYGESMGIPWFTALWNDGVPGANTARNLGIVSAKGGIIAFVDDDAVLFPEWAEEMIKSYEDETIIGVTGPALPLWEDPSMAWFPEEFHWIVSCTSWFECSEISDVRNVWLENASFRRQAFSDAGYLNPALGPQDSMGGFKQREFGEGILSEEVEFSLRVRYSTKKRIVYNPDVKIWHKVRPIRLNWRYIAKWSYWIGCSKRKLGQMGVRENTTRNLLNPEYQLLRRIFSRLLPNILKNLAVSPTIAWRKAWVTATVISFVGLGYCFGMRGTRLRESLRRRR